MSRMDLSGEWRLSQVKGDIKIKASLPGDNYSALLEAEKIPDPYFGLNEKKVQWVAGEDWKYSREFAVGKELLEKKSVYLNLENADTFSEVYINGKNAGKTENMFRRYRFEIKRMLRAGENRIEIIIRSPVKAAAQEYLKEKWLEKKCGHHQVPFVNHIRKTQCHAGWDWGISLIVSGIYGDISLNASDCGRIEHFYSEQKHGKNICEVTLICEYQALSDNSIDMEWGFGGDIIKDKINLVKGLNTIRKSFKVKDPELWWPAGYGAQPLYDFHLKTPDEIVRRKMGIRKLELITEPDKTGETFFFRVNGADIFCKGANWIPADAMPQRINEQRCRRLLSDAVAANMNMLRIWGGGQYEQEIFYEICDELGLLIWHDLMFACMIYPSHPDFMDNVREEVSYQVKRLRSHPCLALWCGDNEITGAVGWYSDNDSEKRERNLVHYDRLNQMLWKTVEDAAGDTARFWPSSPCNGHVDSGAGWKDDARGDFHHWNVFDKGMSLFEAYRSVKPRFCSEFGFQSMPEMKTLRRCVSENQMNLTAPEMENHQRCEYATRKVLETLAFYFRMPSGIEDMVYMTQLQQALVLKNAVEYWRSLTPRCMGALYWQINDNWPVLSWASIDYFGNWKQAHYHAKRFFSPLIITALQNGKEDAVDIFIINDSNEKMKGTAVVKIMDFKGREYLNNKIKFNQRKMSSQKMKTLKLSKEVPVLNERFLYMEIKAEDEKGRVYSHGNEHFFTEYKKCELAKAEISLATEKKGNEYFLKLSTDRPAFFVNLETENSGRFSDNSFTLLPGMRKTVEYISADRKGPGKIKLKHLN